MHPQCAFTSPSTMNRLTPSRRPLANCWASTSQPVDRKRSVASNASGSVSTSVGTIRTGTLRLHETVGLSTNG